MEFLVILIVWAVIRGVGVPPALQRDEWLIAWRLRANAALAVLPSELRLLLVCALPCLLVAMLEWIFAPRLAGIPLFVLELVVLLYSVGRGDFHAELSSYLICWRRGDVEAAYQEAVRAAGGATSVPIDDAVGLHAHMRRRVIYLAFERWFTVVFWFYFLGPWAALFYRILHLSAEHLSAHGTNGTNAGGESDQRLLQQWLAWIEWLPARLLGLAFALTGNFTRCLQVWREHLTDSIATPDLLALYAEHALDSVVARSDGDGSHFAEAADNELQELTALIARSVIGWLLLFAVLQMLR